MKFYYAKAPHSSLPVHIVLEELAMSYTPIRVDLDLEPGAEFLRLNPIGGVPVLEWNDGQALTEIAAILQYLADQKPEAKLAPLCGSMDRYRLQEWLSFIGTELHKGFWPIGIVSKIKSSPEAAAECMQLLRENLEFKFDLVARKLGAQSYLLSHGYTVADAYLFTVLTWTRGVGIDLSRWPNLQAYFARIEARPATVRALSLASVEL